MNTPNLDHRALEAGGFFVGSGRLVASVRRPAGHGRRLTAGDAGRPA
jgi:hypothetical protein